MSMEQWVWPSDMAWQPIDDVPEEMEVEIHPYFQGRLPMDVARRVQASINAGEARWLAEVKRLKAELEQRGVVLQGWYSQVEQRDTTIRSLRAQLANAKRKPPAPEPEPKRRVNAPGWARILAN